MKKHNFKNILAGIGVVAILLSAGLVFRNSINSYPNEQLALSLGFKNQSFKNGAGVASSSAVPLIVEMDPSNPPSGFVNAGQRNFTLAVFKFTALEDLQISRLVFKRIGISSDKDIDEMYTTPSNFYIYDNKTKSFVFPNQALFIPKGQSISVAVAVDINKYARGGSTIGLSLVEYGFTSIADQKKYNQKTNWSGNLFAVVSQQTSYPLLIGLNKNSPAPQNVRPGQKEVVLGTYEITPLFNDTRLYDLVFRPEPFAEGDWMEIKNWKLYEGKALISRGYTIIEGPYKLGAFNFPDGFVIKKGSTKVVKVVGDVVDGSGAINLKNIQVEAMNLDLGRFFRLFEKDRVGVEANKITIIKSLPGDGSKDLPKLP